MRVEDACEHFAGVQREPVRVAFGSPDLGVVELDFDLAEAGQERGAVGSETDGVVDAGVLHAGDEDHLGRAFDLMRIVYDLDVSRDADGLGAELETRDVGVGVDDVCVVVGEQVEHSVDEAVFCGGGGGRGGVGRFCGSFRLHGLLYLLELVEYLGHLICLFIDRRVVDVFVLHTLRVVLPQVRILVRLVLLQQVRCVQRQLARLVLLRLVVAASHPPTSRVPAPSPSISPPSSGPAHSAPGSPPRAGGSGSAGPAEPQSPAR